MQNYIDYLWILLKHADATTMWIVYGVSCMIVGLPLGIMSLIVVTHTETTNPVIKFIRAFLYPYSWFLDDGEPPFEFVNPPLSMRKIQVGDAATKLQYVLLTTTCWPIRMLWLIPFGAVIIVLGTIHGICLMAVGIIYCISEFPRATCVALTYPFTNGRVWKTLRIAQTVFCLVLAIGNCYVYREVWNHIESIPSSPLWSLLYGLRIAIPLLFFLAIVPWWRSKEIKT